MDGDESMHIVLFPFPAQGHFAAFLSLAGRLHRARPSAAVTLVSTPGNVAALRASASASSSLPFLRFHALPFVPEEHGLPAGAESTDALPIRHFLDLFHATESPSLRATFDDFVSSAAATADGRVVLLIADPLLSWTTGVARRRGAGHALFVSCGAFGSAVYYSLLNHLPHQLAPADGDDAYFRLPDHPEVTVHRSQLFAPLRVADGTDPWSAFNRRQIAHARDTDALLVNTTEELEPAGLRMLRATMGGAPVWPVGPLVQERSGSDGDGVVRWLDAKKEAMSVLYISFGSQNSLRPEQMMELAAALELAGRPFVWAIRPPVGSDDDKVGRWLPEGFEERVRGNNTGLLIRGWAPQVRILAHASTGAFLSHCGWNSVLESVTHGVPVIGWPLAGEQFFNAKMLAEEWGVCVEVARGNDAVRSSVVDRARIAEAVETVMGDSADATEMRRRAKEVQDLVLGAQSVGGSSTEALEEFFTTMRRGVSDSANNS